MPIHVDELKSKNLMFDLNWLASPVELQALSAARFVTKGFASGSRAHQRLLSERIEGLPEGLRKTAMLGFGACLGRIEERILTTQGAEFWPNLCPECGSMCRTPVARQCPACHHRWTATPRFRISVQRAACGVWPGQDRVVYRQVPGLGLVVGLADGAGNGGPGASRAADATLEALRVLIESDTTLDQWSIQEMLLEQDQVLGGTGEECAAAVVVLGAGGVAFGAAVGDTRVCLEMDGGWEVYPSNNKTRFRVGSGEADPQAFMCAFNGRVCVLSDGAWPGAPGQLPVDSVQARDLVQSLSKSGGDDSTLVLVNAGRRD